MSTSAKPGQSGFIYPFVSPATDLQSAIAAANAAGRILTTLYNPGIGVNNVYPQQPFGYTRQAGYNGQNISSGVGFMRTLWVEDTSKRVLRTDRIYSELDKCIWIDVEKIQHMELFNTVSGDTIVWDLDHA
jgi:hypothetical protein